MTLLQAKKGYIYTVTEISAGRLTRRLLDMGFTAETRIYVAGVAPFGGTILVGIRGVLIALREDAAGLINITKHKNYETINSTGLKYKVSTRIETDRVTKTAVSTLTNTANDTLKSNGSAVNSRLNDDRGRNARTRKEGCRD